jgi:peptide/nickel transport system substrate-binding protein
LIVPTAVLAVTAMAAVGYGAAQAGGPVITTPAPTKTADTVTWAFYRETATLDPIKAFDYPDNGAVALTCDALVRAKPDMTLGNGIATMSTPSPLKIDFTLHAAKFWDGHPVTAADAVFSLKRAADPKAGGFYSSVFDRVKSITAVGPMKVEIRLSKPDYWLQGELSSPAGEIVEKAYAQKAGAKFGTVTGGTMCSGPFMVSSWKTGQGVTLVPNPNYWDTSLPKPKLNKLVLIGVPDDATLTAGLETGSVSGTYPITLSTLRQLEGNSQVKVYQGPAFGTDALVVNARSGPLADPRVRRALSLAIDRKGIINAVFHGAATIPHALEGPGTWGSGKGVYQAAWNALPALNQNLAEAKKLIQQAGATGKTIRLGTSAQLPAFNTQMLATQAAAKAIGLNAKLVSVSAANYFNFFSNPKVQATVDCFLTINYGDYADPTALYKTIALANGSQNFSKYHNAQVTSLLEKARGTANPDARARLVVKAQSILTRDMVWIPLAMPATVVIMHNGVTGAPATFQYQFGPWGVYLGGD